ncbi:triose-phosphate isomerase [Halobellus limi]|uniref:Triosephosphate isomerase n=1 Tax=Halobellus limi TaxID=699433 RepID=A0A1H6BA96_9EURY|nr:triose-phosphate isomerase [Halobellus limi]QCC49212.1 triosephosphate isomerase [Halobellus limi]SEG57474.1 triosephosphate isomerase [Halobellus limi]
MALEYPTFLINFKRYEGTAGEAGLELAKTIEGVQDRTDTSLAVAPQTPDLYRIVSETDLTVVAQAVDAVEPGRGTGEVGLAAVDAAGVDGVLVNHPEAPTTLADVEAVVEGCRERGLESIVCVDSVETGRAALAFDPDCLLFENPADIASERALAETAPERVEAFVSTVREENPRTRVLLGGGITTAADVRASLDLGADAAGAASAFVDAADREAWLVDIAESLAGSSVRD